MTYMLGLPGALARFGLQVEVVPGWETRGSAAFNPAGSVGHHTAGSRLGERPTLKTVTDGRPGLSGPLCNTYTTRHGIAVVVAAGRANHAGIGGFRGITGNSSVLGHEAESPGVEPDAWAPEHLAAYPRVHAAHLWLTGRDASWYCSHRTWALAPPSYPGRKIDPVDILDAALQAQIAALLAAGGDIPLAPLPGSPPVVVLPPAPSAPPPEAAPPFPLLAGYYFGPKSGPRNSVSGYFSHGGDLQRWQQRMHDRGWDIGVDGRYGPNTADITRRFQVEKHLGADGLIGPATWAAAWTARLT
jgi:hypothetical protein